MTDLALRADTTKFEHILGQLINLTRADPYDPYNDIAWPASIDGLWIAPEFMSIHGTRFEQELDKETLARLNKWECINFFSLNVSGIRDLLVAVANRLHSPGFELVSEYLHCLMAEENEHMWYFAKFCLDYGGKIYPDRTMAISDISEPDIDNFLMFVRALVFEELVDTYNRSMGEDDRLDPFVQHLNRIHHLDEGRHIAYGRAYVELLHSDLRETYPKTRLDEIEDFIKRFMRICVLKLYSPEIYRDAGMDRPARVRKELLSHAARESYNRELMAPTGRFFEKAGILSDANYWQ